MYIMWSGVYTEEANKLHSPIDGHIIIKFYNILYVFFAQIFSSMNDEISVNQISKYIKYVTESEFHHRDKCFRIYKHQILYK